MQTVLRLDGRNNTGRLLWLCRCDCGRLCHRIALVLTTGAVQSCGCSRSKHIGESNVKHGFACGGKLPKEYKIWASIKQRCENRRSRAYPNYGGRGIKICRQWRDDFATFVADMGPRPTPNHTVERRDNDGDYCAENCFWATRKEQGNNKRNNRLLTWNGRTQTLAQWGDETGLRVDLIRDRLKRGWPVEDALSVPVCRAMPWTQTEKNRARWAVQYATRKGYLPKVHTLACVRCGEQAVAYHHKSYEREHRLDVKPLCAACHGLARRE